MNDEKCVVPVPTMSARIAPLTATGTGGTNDYNRLKNKPSINDVELEGNKTLEELGIQPVGDYVEEQEFTDQLGQIDTKIDGKQDVGNYALKSDIPDLSGYPKKEYIDEKIEEVKQEIPDVSSFITNAVDDLINYYKKDETYTQDEVNSLISKIPKMHFEKVDNLPDVGDENTIYLVESENPDEKNVYEEYIYINSEYEIIGTTKVDLSGIQHDIENLTELVTENQDNLITSFTTGKPDGTGLVKVSAVTKNGNIDAFTVYNNVDGKYPYSPLGAQTGKNLNDKIVALQDNVLTKDNTTEYEPETDFNPAPKVYVDRVRDDIPVALSQLRNDLWNEAKSREEAQTLSQQNPGKFYFCQEKEEVDE